MVSKNNKDFYLRKSANKVSKYTIKKLSVGVASVLLSTTFFLGTAASADATVDNQDKEAEATSSSTDTTDLSGSEVTLKSSTAATEEASSSTTTDAVAEQQPATEAQSSSASEDTTASQTEVSSSTDDAAQSSPEQTEKQDTTAENNQQATEEVANTNTTTEQTPQAEDIVTTADATKEAATTTDTPVEVPATFRRISPNASLRAATATPTADEGVTVTSWSQLVSALRNSNNSLINVNGTLTATSTEDIGYSGHKVTVKGQNGAGINFGTNLLTTTGSGWDLTFDNLRIMTDSGRGVIDTGTGSNKITFKDVTHTGNSLFGGATTGTGNKATTSGINTDIVIDGTTTSTVNSAPFKTAFANGKKQYGVTINNKGVVEESGAANIHDAKSVTVADGASFTLNRSSIGDGIDLVDGGAVRVGDKATFTVNLNTNNATDNARYHNAGIFMENGGSFTSGREAKVTFNTSIGQAISIGADRPGINVTDADRFGGYTANQSRNAGPSTVTLGEYSTFDFTGRDGIILGNNSKFISGEYSNVHFQNKGNGVALDLANDSLINISKHSNTLFESDGKGNKAGTDGSDTISGSYNAYNYIGVNEGGNILIDEFATFRVILTNRGANPWDDVISLDSRKATTSASFVSKKGAIVDIRDDNTNFYAELISFPLGAANSLIDIQDPLYLNLQRYSAGGATEGWMPVGGVDILNTSAKWTANLIYMGGNKGVLRIGGTDYVVYQQIKSDDSKQIWLDVNSVDFAKTGFTSKNDFDNGANPDISIAGQGLTSGVAANNIKDQNNSPLVKAGKGTVPYYGISTQRANHQIWFPHKTENQAAGNHKNIIKYVYEDGTEAAPTVTQEVDMTRNLVLSITEDKIKDIQNYAANHTADETLAYIRNAYAVTGDTGWKIDNAVNTKTSYDAVTSPTIAGYTAEIQSTNANGVTTGANASEVHAILDIPESIVENGQLTEAYKNNGTTGIPANYETVVVYKKEVQNQTVTIIYQDKTNNDAVLATDTITGKPGTELGYTTTDKITELTNKGYKLVTDGVPKNGTFGDAPETYYVTFEHDTVTVTPNDPKGPDTPINPNDPASPKYPTEAQADNLKATATLTVHYKDEAGATKAADKTANVEVTRTVTIDKVTGEVLSTTPWTAANADYASVATPVVDGYVATTEEYDTNDGRGTINADKAVDGVKVVVNANAQTGAAATTPSEVTVVYKQVGNYVPVDSVTKEPIPGATKTPYANDPSDPTKVTGNNTPTTPTGYDPQNPNGTNNTYTPNTDPTKDTEQEFVKTPDAQRATLTVVDKDKNNAVLATASQTGKPGEKIADVFADFSVPALEGKTVDEVVKYYTDRGYEVESNDYKSGTDFDNDSAKDQNFTIVLKHGTTPVTPENPGKPGEPINPNDPDGPKWPEGTDKDSVQKPVKETVHYTGADDKTPADVVQDATWTRELTVDKVTGEIVKTGDWTPDKENYDEVKTPVVEGYVADKATVPSTAVTLDDIEVTVTYTKVGKIVPVDPEGNEIPGVDQPSYNNDPEDPTKVTPNQPVPSIPGYTPEVPTVTPDDPTKDTPVKYTKEEVAKYTLVENFVDEAGNKLADSVTKGTEYEEGNDYDVTGDAKVIEGYYLKEVPANAKGTFGKDNVTVDFVYAKVGKIVPVDPSGKEIPGAPTPDYTNDPEDPTKVTPNQPTPEVPGWHVVPNQPTPGVSPDGKTVTPPTPGEDTKVVYEKNEENKYTLVENFVDEAGNKLADSVTKGTEYEEGNDYDVTGDAKVIEGYYLKEVPANAKGTFGSEDVTVNFVYAKVGKIVPQDPEGNPIPNAPTPEYTNDPNDPTKVTPNQPVPEIPGYTPQVPSVTPDKPGEDTPVIYVKNQDQKAVVKYIDDTTGETLETKDLAGKAGATSDYRTADTIANYVNKGYELVSDNYPADGVVFDDDDKTTQSFEVHLKHGTTPVTPENPGKPGEPINPNDPEGPKWPEGTDKDSVQKPVKETVHYTGAGDKTPADVVQDATWTRELTVDKVTGKIINEGDWKSDKDNYDEVKTPVVEGYVADKATVPSTAVTQDNIEVTVTYTKVGKIVPVDPEGNEIPGADQPSYKNDPDDPTKVVPNQPVPEIPGFVPEVSTVTPPAPGEDTPVKYVPVTPEAKDQTAKVIYRDETTGQDISSDSITGKPGSKIDYSTADKIKELEDKGYVLVNDGFPAGVTFDNDDNVDQTYYVTFKHGTTPVTPENPGKPGEPINPNDPDGPKWPAGTDKDSVQKNVKETVHYVGADDKTPSDVVQDATWTRELTVDKVTGEIVSTGDWKSDKDNYDEVKTPVVEGYVADKATVPSTAVTQDDIEVTVTYTKVGKIVPVDPSGKEIPDAPTPDYKNDPEDPTKVTPNQPVPEIPGFVPQVPTVTPDKPGEDTPVVYVPVTPEETTQNAKVIYRDTTTGQELDSADLTGKSGSKIDYSTADKIKELTDKGYVLVNDGFPTDALFDNDGDVDQTYYVNFKHGEEPVGPNNPHEPGEPINPNDPDGPKWPAKDEYTKEFTSTVHFVDDKGNKVFDDDVQKSTWTRTLIVDTVTGEVKNPNESWKSDKDKYTDVTAPVVDGYYADKDRVAGEVAVQENLEETITYKPLGNIVPVDPEGNKIPGAPTPQYNNDPKDPTKGGKTPVPEIPGYTPQVPSVTPEKPGEDTPVVYVKNDPNKPTVPTQNDQKAKIVYYDVTTDTTLDESDLTGKPGDKINYSTADKIKELTNKGYVLVKDGFPSDAAFDKNDDVDQTYYVTFKHGEAPVGPNDPHEPGTPINPNDPEGPKWPAKDEYTKEFTSTVHFVDNKGNKVKDDDVQTSTWTRTLYVDTVTGEVKNPNESWKSDKDKYAEVTAPVIEDYYADKASVPAKDTVQENIEETITYNPVGKIVPVGPNGEPIPGAPTPEYSNDPNDPTKVTPNQPVPEIPGYTPEVPTVTPDKPGEDTPVKYVKDEAKYSLTVKFVDEAGNELAPQAVKGSDYKKGADYDVSGDAKVIEGYYLKETPANAKGTIGSDNVTVTFVYAKLGNIVPVDPSGTPIPGADTPTYSNDPEDPSKVVPNQPVPVVPGYTPQVPSVTPDKPGEDTPVVYVPVTPEKDKQAARIIYRDTTTGTVIDSVDVYGDPDSKIDYSTADKIKELTNKGYVLVEDGFPAEATFDNDDNTVQTYYVTFKHGEQPVGPDNPHEPGTPINPNDPNGPKWPAKDEYTKQYTSTVQFVDKDGNKLRDDDVQTSTWTRTLIVDSVTGKVKNPNQAWTSDKGKYDDVTAPVIEDYYADKSRVTGKTTVQENLVEKITYTPLGKITPQDPNGNPIPGAPTPGYNNDPKDPTKGGITPVPEIPGYTPRVPSVNPEDPGKDTPVVYEKNEDPKKPDISNERDQTAKIIFRDVTTDTDLATEKFTGKSGSKITYSTADKIKELLAKGYVLVNDGFPSDAAFDNDNDVDQTYYVTFKHGEAPVGPSDPHEPGTPINPNDPNGPKWPAKDEYTKEFTSTVHFVDKDGNKLRDDDVQTSTWTRTLIVDTVTGKVKNPDAAWTSDKGNYNDVKVPVIEGYYADKANVPGPKATQENIETNVVYNKIGKIVPVDPEGNPIPGAPTPQYKNDPNDPTKVVVTDTPDVPGYTTGIISVDPGMPGEDTPVVYTKVEESEKTPEPVKPDTPAPTVVTPEAKPQPQPQSQQQPAAELPQTGDADNNTMAAIGAAMVAGLLGLMAFTSKKKKDGNEI
ncbi:MucBP domain-containing protein [Ligilactobacillus murinus]|uniref:mucin-binding protein n=1 Tax=Ligilactobacillus murinus TaxID=1622 RepID=UPI00296AF892|nr:MucBP domain-containing protein [Ligilactobacillus murinus]WOY89711.1 MucBP domain-containing protein [Ligilactobacillus murinus]